MKPIALNGYEKRPYYGKDINNFKKRYGLTTTDLSNLFCRNGMSASAFQKKIKNEEDLLTPTHQILLRLYIRYPEIIQIPERITTADFFENELGGEAAIATRFRGVLFGVDRNSSYNWNKDAVPESSVKAAMIAAKNLKKVNNLEQDELLQILLDICNITAETLDVNPMKVGSWHRGANDVPLQFSLESVCEKSVKNRGRRVHLAHVPKMTSTNLTNFVFNVRAKLSDLILEPTI